MNWYKLFENTYRQVKDKLWFFFLGNFVFGVIYFFVASESLKLATLNTSVSPVWPPTGLAIATLYLFGRQFLPGIFLGAWLVNFLTPISPVIAVLIGLGNMLEAFAGYFLIVQIRRYQRNLEHLTMPIALGVSSIFAPLISATVGVGSLLLIGDLKPDVAVNAWLTWWVGDIVGALLIVPLVVSIHAGDLKSLIESIKVKPKDFFVLCLSSVLSLSVITYLLANMHSLKYLLVILPLMLVFTSSKNRLFIYLFGTAIPVIALLFAVNNSGPFNLSSFNQNLLNLEIFVVGIFFTVLILADIVAYVHQRRVLTILIAGWIFWGTIFYNLQTTHQDTDARNMALVTKDMELRIAERLNEYIDVVNGGRSLFVASEHIDPIDWRNYVSSLSLEEHTPGIHGIGIIYPVAKENVQAHYGKYRRYFDNNFQYKIVSTKGSEIIENDKESLIVTYIEPLEKNKTAIGADFGSERQRRETAIAAMKSGKVQITPALRLMHDKQSRVGYLIFLPVYKRGANVNTEAARIANFSHWVYAPFLAETFLSTIFNRFNEPLNFELYDKADYAPSSIVYANKRENINSAGVVVDSKLSLAGRDFYIRWTQSNGYEGSHDFLSTWIGLIGIVSVLIVALFIINIQTTGEKARLLANQLHSDFLKAQSRMKEQEAKIAESSKMASLGEMASSIAHEINNPLTIIYGKARQIQYYLDQPNAQLLHAKIQADALKIITTVDRISRIIKGLRKISRDASGDSMTITTVKELIDETLSFCQQRFQQSSIDFRLNMNYTGDVFCRQTEISQVILNLLNNSYDAVLALDTRWVELHVDKIENNLVIAVTDSGRGISKEVQNKIFQPFFTTKEVGKGTGLGLSISKGIIEAHSGRFYLDETASNTKFIVEIPLNVTSIKTNQAA